MTEINIYSAGDNNKKTQAKSQTRQASNQLPDIEIFGGKTEGSGTPYKPADKKMPSIFDNKVEFKPKEIKVKNDTPPVPLIDGKMRLKYTEQTTLGIFKGLSQKNVSAKNTETLMQTIHTLDPKSYKFAFQVFANSGYSLPEMVMNTKHLSEAQKKQCLQHMVNVGKDVANYNKQRSDDVLPKMQDLVKKYDTKKGLPELDKKRLAADFKKIVNRSDTTQARRPRPNGKIDIPFRQGQTGDCWLLAGIQSLSMTPQGKKVLDNAVKVDKQGNATVTLKGVGKTYKVTARDLKCSNELSSGDSDVRALEIAMDRYFRETVPDGKADIDGNYVGKALELLGDPNHTSTAVGSFGVQSMIDYIQGNGMSGRAAVTGMTPDVDTRGMGATDAKTGEEVHIYNAHAYSVKDVDDKNIYLVNPHDTSKTIKLPLKSYLNKFNMIALSDVRSLK